VSEFDNSRVRRRDSAIRDDLLVIANLIESGSRVLDIGCGDGALLDYLARHSDVDARGLEVSQERVKACVSRSLSVIQGNADIDLRHYPDQAFDYVVLSLTLQATLRPREVIAEMVRIGQRAIVSFPNFGYWRVRWDLLRHGRMPVTETLRNSWYETPNIHLCTIRDFVLMCRDLGLTIERRLYLSHDGTPQRFQGTGRWANLFGEQGLFTLRRD
jgi:methionine biosynthesis protein MetW